MISSTLFTKFPKIKYGNQIVTDISVRLKFKDIITKNMVAFYPYVLTEGERADTVAHKYYGDASYTWLLYLGNDMLDPIHDWPYNSEQFEAYINRKYGSLRDANNRILFYRVDWASDESLIDPSRYNAFPSYEKKYWKANTDARGQVNGYERQQLDWIVETNKIVSLTLSSSSHLQVGDIVYQQEAGARSAEGEVEYVQDPTTILVKNVSGVFSTKTLAVDRVTNLVNCLGVTIVHQNIPAEEERYWAPVSAIDYESELNEAKKHIRIIDNAYVDLIESNLRELVIT